MEGGGSGIGGRQVEAWGRGYEEKVQKDSPPAWNTWAPQSGSGVLL